MSNRLFSTVASIEGSDESLAERQGDRRWVSVGVALSVGLALVVLLVAGMSTSSRAAPLALPNVSFNLTSDPNQGSLLAAGDRVTYMISLGNSGDDPATSFILTNTLPGKGLQFVSAEPAGYTQNGDAIVWNVGNLPIGAQNKYTVVAQLASTQVVLHARLTNRAEADWAETASPQLRTIYHDVEDNAIIAKPNTTSVIDTYNDQNEAVAGELVTITVYFTIPQGTIVYSATPRVVLQDGLWPDGTDPVTVSSFITTSQYKYPNGDFDRVAAADGHQLEFASIDEITDTDSGPRAISFTVYAHARQYRFLTQQEVPAGDLRVQPILRWCDEPGCAIDYNDQQSYVAHDANHNPPDRPNVRFVRPDVRRTAMNHTYLDAAGIGEGGGLVRFDIENRNQGGAIAYNMVFTATLAEGLSYSDSSGDAGAGEGTTRVVGDQTLVTWTVPVSLLVNGLWNVEVTATLPTTFIVGSEFTCTTAMYHETFPGSVPDKGMYVNQGSSYDIMPGVAHTKQASPDDNVKIGDIVTYTVLTTLGSDTVLYSPNYTDSMPAGFHYLSGTLDVDGAVWTGIITAPDGLDGIWVKEDFAWYMDDLDRRGMSTLVVTTTYQAEFSGLDTSDQPVYSDNLNKRTVQNKAALYWMAPMGVSRSTLGGDNDADAARDGVGAAQPNLRNNDFTTSRTGVGDVEVGDTLVFETHWMNRGSVDGYDVHVCDDLPQGVEFDRTFLFDPGACSGASLVSEPLAGDEGTVCWIIDKTCPTVDMYLQYWGVVLDTAIPGVQRTNNTHIDDYSSQPGGTNDGDMDDDDLPVGVRFDRHYMDFPSVALPDDKQCSTGCPFTVLGLEARKTAEQSSVAPGGFITYTLAYTDTSGDRDYTGVVITDDYDLHLNFVTATVSPRDSEAHPLVWDVSVPHDGGGDIVLTMQVDPVVGDQVFVLTNTMEWGSNETVPKQWVVTTSLSVPNLHVQVTGPMTTHADAAISYTVVYSNDGSVGQPVTLTLDYGDYLTFDSASLTPVAGTDYVFTDTLPAGGVPHTLTIQLLVNAPLPYTLHQIDSSVTIESTGATPDSDDVTVALQYPEFDFSKVVPAGAAPPVGQLMQYRFHLENTGDFTATNVVITDTWDPSTSFASGSGWSVDSGYATYTVASLAPGAVASVSDLFVTVDTEEDQYLNTANLSCDQTTVQTTTDQTWAPSIATYKTVEPDPAFPGRSLTYTIYYTNGSVNVVNAVITDHLPSASIFSFVGCTQPGGWDPCAQVGEELVWERNFLQSGDTGQFQVWGTVTTTENLWLLNWTESNGGGVPQRPGEVFVETRVARPWLGAAKSVAPAHPVAPGDSITYTLVYSNYGSDPAYDVVLTDDLPDQVTFTGCDQGCAHDSGVVTWNLGEVTNDSVEYSVTITATVNAGTEGQMANNDDYTIQSQRLDPIYGAPVQTSILAPALTLVKAAEPRIVSAQYDPIAYTIFYTNSGGGALHNLVIADTLSQKVTFDSASPGCSHDDAPLGGVVTCIAGDLEQGEGGLIEIHVQDWTTTEGDEIPNQATGDADEIASTSSNSAPVWFYTSTDIPPLGAEFDYTPDAPEAGELVTFIGMVAAGVEPITYTWDLGDGTFASGQVVSHTYDFGSTYAVVMTATNDYGEDVYTENVIVIGGDPEISVDPTALDVGLNPGGTTTLTLTIHNTGSGDLTGSVVESPDVSWLTVTLESGGTLLLPIPPIPPNNSAEVVVDFDASGLAIDVYTTTLLISSNDPLQPLVSVPVTLTVQEQAEITVDPSSLLVTLNAGDTTSRTLTIGNQGAINLTWSLAESPAVGWLGEAPTGGTVTPMGSEDVVVTFSATDLMSSTYTTTLQITSNDPDGPVSVPVSMVVVRYDIFLPIVLKNT
ncbi:MAG: PKD domain-containing protein [Chloroflexota bacterium]|nr:PKD domain-containing protein [Chloroflexota bacterium]